MALLQQAMNQQAPQSATPDVAAPAPPREGVVAAGPEGVAPGGVAPGGAVPVGPEAPGVSGEEQATPAEQQEYEQALKAVAAMVYGDDRSNEAIIKAIMPENLVGSIAQASMTVIAMVDSQIDMDEAIIADITMDTVNMVVEVAEEGAGVQVGETEHKQALATTWEGVLHMFGGEEPIAPDFQEMTQGLSPESMRDMGAEYDELLSYGEGPGDTLSGPPTEGIGPSPAVRQSNTQGGGGPGGNTR